MGCDHQKQAGSKRPSSGCGTCKSDGHSFRYGNADANTASKLAERNKRPRNNDVFKAVSIFVHRFNLLFQFWFINCCIQCAFRLCYCCCPLAVCLDQLRLILLGVHWTLQMSASNLLIPFISVCSSRQRAGVFACAHVAARARGRVCQRQMATRDCVCVLEMSRSHLHWSLCPAEEGGRAPPRALVACLRPLSFSLCFLTYARAILSLLFSVSFVSYSPSPCLWVQHFSPLSLSASHRMSVPTVAALHILAFYCSVYFYLTSIQSPSFSPSLHLPPLDPPCFSQRVAFKKIILE